MNCKKMGLGMERLGMERRREEGTGVEMKGGGGNERISKGSMKESKIRVFRGEGVEARQNK